MKIIAAKERVRQLLGEQSFEHVTVEVELEGEPCGLPLADEDSAR